MQQRKKNVAIGSGGTPQGTSNGSGQANGRGKGSLLLIMAAVVFVVVPLFYYSIDSPKKT